MTVQTLPELPTATPQEIRVTFPSREYDPSGIMFVITLATTFTEELILWVLDDLALGLSRNVMRIDEYTVQFRVDAAVRRNDIASHTATCLANGLGWVTGSCKISLLPTSSPQKSQSAEADAPTADTLMGLARAVQFLRKLRPERVGDALRSWMLSRRTY